MKFVQFSIVLMLLVAAPLSSTSDCDGISDINKREDPTTLDPNSETTTPVESTTEEATTVETTTEPPTTETTITTTTTTTTKTTTVSSGDPCVSSTTTTACSPAARELPTAAQTKTSVQTLVTLNDCAAQADGTLLVDGRHCRRYYICQNGRSKRLRCSLSQWFDRETLTCLDRKLVTSCPINRT